MESDTAMMWGIAAFFGVAIGLVIYALIPRSLMRFDDFFKFPILRQDVQFRAHL